MLETTIPVHFIYPGEEEDNWILSRMGSELLSRISFQTVWPRPGKFHFLLEKQKLQIEEDHIYYFLDHPIFTPTKGIGGAFFTHPESTFNRVGELVDFGICMCKQYMHLVNNPHLVYPGIDDCFKPKLILGFAGRTYGDGRKGEDLLDKVAALDFVTLKRTDGGLLTKELPQFYSQLDYVLVTSNLEGGPMCIIEGAAIGKKTICPLDVGFARDFSQVVIPYEKSNWESLKSVLHTLYEAKLQISNIVASRTWQRFAEEHVNVFNKAKL